MFCVRAVTAADSAQVRGDLSARLLVDPAAGGCSRVIDVHRLFPVGGLSGQSLRIRALPVAVLLAVAVRRQPSPLVLAEARLGAWRAAVFRGALHPLGAGRIPLHLLLLPRRLLQGVLAGSARLHGRRAAEILLG